MNINRNDKCVCGSGKKFKNCCGKKGAQTKASNPWLKWLITAVISFFLGFTVISIIKPLFTTDTTSDLYEYVRCENPNCKTLHPRLKSRNNTELSNSKQKRLN